METITFEIDAPRSLPKYRPFDVALPLNENGSKNRVLFVFDEITDEEIEHRCIMTGDHGSLLINLVNYAKSKYLRKSYDRKFAWSTINFTNCQVPKGKKAEYHDVFSKRVLRYIKKFKPTTVVCFGHRFLQTVDNEFGRYEHYSKYLGVPVEIDADGVKFTAVPSINLIDILDDFGEDGLANILGLCSQHIANGIAGELQYAVDSKRILNAEIRMIDTIKKFDKMMDELRSAKYVACDTETDSLNKVAVKMLTIQFATCLDHAYILPFYHKDTPFSVKELKYIAKTLKKFYEGRNKNSYHIYCNSNFDLNVERNNLSVDFFPTNLWDVIAGEFALDENLKYILSAPYVQFKPYALESIAVRYGFNAYGKKTIAKTESKNIANMSLSDGKLQRYMVYDVLVPIAVHQLQKRKAKELNYHKYQSVVTEQISDMIHTFSTMNKNGLPIDIDFLLYLKQPDSPIEAELRKMEQEIYSTVAAKNCNRRLMQEANIPSKGLFGKVETWILDLHKPAHKAMFFFKELKLKALAKGKSGVGKVDKKFQAHYKDVPEVKAFTALGKAEKLRNSYVNSFLRWLRTDDDFKSDHHIRPSFDYKGVVTGRISESDPNCQQIPSRGELGKNIKRLFRSLPGTLFIKVDYSAHEVRGLSLISGDEVLAGVFQVGLDLRTQFRMNPTPELAKEIELKGDVHKLNVAFFFGKDLTKISKEELKELRDQIKGVVFGLIYGMTTKTLATSIKQAVDFVEKLIRDFFKRFKKGGKWLTDIEKVARENYFVESPLGRRRNLYAYLLPKSYDKAEYLHSAMDRRARNAPIQGMGSDFGFMGARIITWKAWERMKEFGKNVLKLCNMVHDSLENVCDLEHMMFGLNVVQWALTDGVRDLVKKRHNFDFVVGLEIDMEIGPTLRDCQKWDGSLLELMRVVAESLAIQKYKFGYDVNIKGILRHMLTEQKRDMPDYLKHQLKKQGMPDIDTIVKVAVKKIKESNIR